MKAVAINGSPRATGNTYNSLKIIENELIEENIEFELLTIGNKNIRGCVACNNCFRTRNERCNFDDDIVNEAIQKMKEADIIILSSPVYFADIPGTMKSFLDRVFYVSGANGGLFRQKIGSAVVAVRRSGGVPTFNSLNNYLTYSEMVVASSNYWNVIHGTKPGEIVEDNEGVQTLKLLAKNIIWLAKSINFSKENVVKPRLQKKIFTNFI